jgi:hypothetical protein
MPDFRLDRLTLVPIVDRQGKPTQAQQRLWQRTVEKIEAAFTDLSTQLAAIQAAQTAAATADTKATAAAREAARINSYTEPTNMLSAADAGSDASITIGAHDRIYPVQGTIDVPDLTLVGGSITGLAFSTEYHVYYDDTTLSDTTPNYLATTTRATAQVGAAAGRHFVGTITTPADGGGGTTGTGTFPPGGGGGGALP